MRVKDEALKGRLILCAQDIVNEEGPSAVNIRSIAQRAGVATGTVYNYFASKDEILLCLIQAYWERAMEGLQGRMQGNSFWEQIQSLYAFLLTQIDGSAGELMKGLENMQAAGQGEMRLRLKALRDILVERIKADGGVRGSVWSESFTMEMYADFLLSNLLLCLRRRDTDICFLSELIRRSIY